MPSLFVVLEGLVAEVFLSASIFVVQEETVHQGEIVPRCWPVCLVDLWRNMLSVARHRSCS